MHKKVMYTFVVTEQSICNNPRVVISETYSGFK